MKPRAVGEKTGKKSAEFGEVRKKTYLQSSTGPFVSCSSLQRRVILSFMLHRCFGGARALCDAVAARGLAALPRFYRSTLQEVSPGSAVPIGGGLLALNTLSDNVGSQHQAKRVGRGIGSGLGKTSGRGMKGQKARSGTHRAWTACFVYCFAPQGTSHTLRSKAGRRRCGGGCLSAGL